MCASVSMYVIALIGDGIAVMLSKGWDWYTNSISSSDISDVKTNSVSLSSSGNAKMVSSSTTSYSESSDSRSASTSFGWRIETCNCCITLIAFFCFFG